MSFSYNPYKHIELVQGDDASNPDLWIWYCHGCGAGSKEKWRITIPIEIQDILHDYFKHLILSHKRSSADFEGWSRY